MRTTKWLVCFFLATTAFIVLTLFILTAGPHSSYATDAATLFAFLSRMCQQYLLGTFRYTYYHCQALTRFVVAPSGPLPTLAAYLLQKLAYWTVRLSIYTEFSIESLMSRAQAFLAIIGIILGETLVALQRLEEALQEEVGRKIATLVVCFYLVGLVKAVAMAWWIPVVFLRLLGGFLIRGWRRRRRRLVVWLLIFVG